MNSIKVIEAADSKIPLPAKSGLNAKNNYVMLKGGDSEMNRIFSDDMSMLKKMKCPFIYEPYEDCYCAAMNSQNIEKALHFCGENFIRCGIYKMMSDETGY